MNLSLDTVAPLMYLVRMKGGAMICTTYKCYEQATHQLADHDEELCLKCARITAAAIVKIWGETYAIETIK